MSGALFPPFYPPAYPIAPAIIGADITERLTINGVHLDTYAYLLTDISGIMTSPPMRGDNVTVPGRHGVIRTPSKRFDSAEIVLPMWVNGALPDGSIPTSSTARQEFFKRRDELLQLLHADPLTLQYTRPDGSARSASCELAAAPLDFTRLGVGPEAQVSVALSLLDPFWAEVEDTAQTITGPTDTVVELTAFAGSTAPVTDARITFSGPVSNPRLALGHRWLQFNGVVAAGQELVLECEHWRASPGAGDVWSPPVTQVYRDPGPCWLEIPPSFAPQELLFTHTGGGTASVEIAGKRKYLSP